MVSKILTVLFLIVACHLGGFSPLATAQSSSLKFDMSEVHWDSLVFKSDKFLGTVTTRVVLEELHFEEVKDMLIVSPQGVTLKPSGAKVFLLTINSAIDPLIGSRELFFTRVWFSPRQASALQRIRLRKKEKKNGEKPIAGPKTAFTDSV